MFSMQCLRLGLRGYLIRFAPLAFIPHRQICSREMPSLIVSPAKINIFYHYLSRTSRASQSQVRYYSLHAALLSRAISQRNFLTGYECFRPNKSGTHLDCRDYRGGWHRSCPVLIPLAFYTREKFLKKEKHSGLLCHPCGNCRIFLAAALRRARTSVSESFSGHPLSGPLLIIGLVVHYTANNLISRSLILWHEFE